LLRYELLKLGLGGTWFLIFGVGGVWPSERFGGWGGELVDKFREVEA